MYVDAIIRCLSDTILVDFLNDSLEGECINRCLRLPGIGLQRGCNETLREEERGQPVSGRL